MMTRGWPANSLAIFFMCGSSSLQGPHQVAQKSIRTTRPPMASSLNFEPSRAVTVKARGHLVGGERRVFGEVLGAEVAGVVGLDAGEAGLELVAGRVHLVETGEHLAVQIVGRERFWDCRRSRI